MIKIPLTNQPNQAFKTTILFNNVNVALELFIYWNRIAGYWQMTITNSATNEEILTGMPLLTGRVPVQSFLRQQAYFGIGAAYVVPIANNAPDSPGENDWDTNFILLWDGQ